MRFIKPLFLKIETTEQMNTLEASLQMQYDYQNDIVLDSAVTQCHEVRDYWMMI